MCLWHTCALRTRAGLKSRETEFEYNLFVLTTAPYSGQRIIINIVPGARFSWWQMCWAVAINLFNAHSEKSNTYTRWDMLTSDASSIASNTVSRAFTNYNWPVINDTVVIDSWKPCARRRALTRVTRLGRAPWSHFGLRLFLGLIAPTCYGIITVTVRTWSWDIARQLRMFTIVPAPLRSDCRVILWRTGARKINNLERI